MSEQRTPEDQLRDEALAEIAKSGRCYTNEARSMACEIIYRRSRANSELSQQELDAFETRAHHIKIGCKS